MHASERRGLRKVNVFVVALIGLFSLAIAVPLPSTLASPRSLKPRAFLGTPLVPCALTSSSTDSEACVDRKAGLRTGSTVQVNGPRADITMSEGDTPLPFVSRKAPLGSLSHSSRNASANHEHHANRPRPELTPLPVGSDPAEGGVVVERETA